MSPQSEEAINIVQAEESVVQQMLSSMTISALQNRLAPTPETVMHHLKLAYKRAGFIATRASTIRILKRISREIDHAETVLEFISRGDGQPH
ncbi:hypothetical protein P0R31_27685 [Bradyrhizobium yuanmingense]|uniref:hypothetical protein n=1 Tax=Bradyrhizobium yuanmingense TaxID=108015 RepID=UPI0023B96CEE|nr:hypothetical protein [Bradyrhizobium yuanmingense]MDF0521032.1 hypothetical protein [Bradyrhizobium yuanmingense]